MIELHLSMMGRKSSEIAMMQVNISGFSLQSSSALNNFINENNWDLVALSESRGFDNYDIYPSRATKYGSSLIVKRLVKTYAVDELFFDELDVCFTVFNTETEVVLMGLLYAPLSNQSSFNSLLDCCSHVKKFCVEKVKGPHILGVFSARHVKWGDELCNTYGKSLLNFRDENIFIVKSTNEHTYVNRHLNGGCFMTFVFAFSQYVMTYLIFM